MCLNRITKRYKPSLFNLWIPELAYKSGSGWKEFRRDENGNLISRFNNWGKGILPEGKFVNEKDYRKSLSLRIEGTQENYDFGWHICTSPPERIIPRYNIEMRRVEYEYGHTVGIDRRYRTSTIVAKYMKIIKEK